MHTRLHDSTRAAEWERLRPMIDDAIHDLNDRDREAVLLRFFEGQPFAAIGATLNVSEDGARMRVERALDKLQAQANELAGRFGWAREAAELTALLGALKGESTPYRLSSDIARARRSVSFCFVTCTRGSKSSNSTNFRGRRAPNSTIAPFPHDESRPPRSPPCASP